MKVLRRMLIAAICVTVTVVFSIPAFADTGSLYGRFAGHMVGTTTNVCYYAVGIDGGGPLYKYNVVTKKKTKLASGKWLWLNQKGKYLYLGKNNYGGSDGRDYYIYRVKKNGKTKKKLANGRCPIVKGKYIYYMKTLKGSEGKVKFDTRTVGIYRMSLTGKNKKCLVKFNQNSYYGGFLGATQKRLLYLKDGKWKAYNLKTRKITSPSAEIISNLSLTYWGDYGEEQITSVKKNGYYYYPASNVLYKYSTKTGKDTKVTTVKGKIKKIIHSGNQLMVISETSEKYRVVIMKTSGKYKKLIKTGYLVSGGWNY